LNEGTDLTIIACTQNNLLILFIFKIVYFNKYIYIFKQQQERAISKMFIFGKF